MPLGALRFFVAHSWQSVQTHQALQILLTARTVQRESQTRIPPGTSRDAMFAETHQLHARCASHGDAIVDGLEQRKSANIAAGGDKLNVCWQCADGFIDQLMLRILLRDVLVFALPDIGRMQLDEPVQSWVGTGRTNGFDKPLARILE